MVAALSRVTSGVAMAIPASPPGSIRRRASLWEKLQQYMDRRLIVVQAGSGCGKTTFLASYAQALREAGDIPVAWLTLERLHRDRVQLLADLVLALRAIWPDLGDMTATALQRRRDAPRRWDYLLELFCREVYDVDGHPALIILDQFERIIPSQGARETIDYLVAALPPTLTLLLATRQPPDLSSLPRLRMQAEVGDISTRDLCFTIDEVRDYFQRQPGLSITDPSLATLLERTGGWPAGVQIAAALASGGGAQALSAFSGSLPQVYDYLDREVFAPEEPGARSFLLSTALVDSLTPEVGRVLARDADGLAALARLERGDYFVTASRTGDQRSYQHSPLFRDFLSRKLAETFTVEQLRALHRELAAFYRRGQQWEEAIQHLLQAQDYQEASELVASLAETLLATNKLDMLAGWIDAFPREARDRWPWLLLYRGVVHRVNREWETALSLYQWAIDLFRVQGDRKGLGRALWYSSQVLAYRRQQRQALEMATDALTYLDPGDRLSRAWILHSMGNCYGDLGQPEACLHCHQEAEGLFVSLGDAHGEMMQNHALALVRHRLGRLKEAQHHYLRALGMQARTGDLNVLCWVQAGLAHLRAQRGEYGDATAGLTEVLGITREQHLRPVEVYALSCLVEVSLDRGSYPEAEGYGRQALALGPELDDDAPAIDLQLKLAELYLRQGEVDRAEEISVGITEAIARSRLTLPWITQALLQAALLLARQQYEEAGYRALEARRLAQQGGARYHEARALYLLARTRLRQGEAEASARLVEELIAMVEEEGYAGFLVRDAAATGEVLANALRRSAQPDRLVVLLLRLAEIRQDVVTSIWGGETPPGIDQAGDLRQKLQRYGRAPGGEEASAIALPPPAAKTAAAEDREAATAGVDLEVWCLGPLRVRHEGKPITDRAWRTSKAKELFAYLLTRASRSASRDELLEVLWPELSTDLAASNLHFTVHSLRRSLEPGLAAGSASRFLTLQGRQYCLALPSRTVVDVWEFQAWVSEGTRLMRQEQMEAARSALERAVAIYQGAYLVDLDARWAESERLSLQRVYLDTLRQLAWMAYIRRDYRQVIHHAHSVLSRDPDVESAHRLIMRAACEMGEPDQALRQYDELCQRLQKDLGAQPALATRKLERRIRTGAYRRPALVDGLAAAGAPPSTAATEEETPDPPSANPHPPSGQ